MLDGVDYGNGATHFRRYPQLGAVGRECRETRPLINENAGHDFSFNWIDEMRHIGCFRRIDENFTVGTHDHAFRLYSDLHLSNLSAPRNVDDRHGVIVFISDVKQLAIASRSKKLRIWAGRQRVDDGIAAGVD